MWILFDEEDAFLGCTNNFDTVKQILIKGRLPLLYFSQYTPEELLLHNPYLDDAPKACAAIKTTPDDFNKPTIYRIELPETDHELIAWAGEDEELRALCFAYFERRKRQEVASAKSLDNAKKASEISKTIGARVAGVPEADIQRIVRHLIEQGVIA